MRHLYRLITTRGLNRLLWTTMDQAIFALSNFIMNILFARWLPAADYGLFMMSFSGYMLLCVLHWGGMLEPLLVLSAQIERHKQRTYITTLGWAHLLVLLAAIVLAATAAAIALATGHQHIGYGLFGAVVGGCLMMTLVTARRLCLVFLSPRVSAMIGVIYFVGVIATTAVMRETAWLSWMGLWVVMGGWSLVCSLVIFAMLRHRTTATAPFTMRNLLTFQTQYAPGAILASFGDWLSLDGVILLLGSLAGLPAVAETRAVFTLANPFLQANAVLHVTWLIRFAEQGNKAKLFKLAGIYALGMAACVGLLAVIADGLIGLLYAGRYVATAWQLPALVAAIGLSGVSAMVTSLFKTRGGLWQGFLPSVIGGCAAVIGAAIAIPFFAQEGAFYAIIGGSVASLVSVMLLYRFAFPQTRSLQSRFDRRSERQTSNLIDAGP